MRITLHRKRCSQTRISLVNVTICSYDSNMKLVNANKDIADILTIPFSLEKEKYI